MYVICTHGECCEYIIWTWPFLALVVRPGLIYILCHPENEKF